MERQPWVAIQRNPTSGSGRGRDELLALISNLKRQGYRVRLFSRRDRMDRVLNSRRDTDPPVCIVAAGGDGTIGSVFNRFCDVPIAILPLGTENLLARYLKIPCSGEFVSRMICDGSIRSFDLGALGDRRFAIMASVGFDAEVVHRTDAMRTGTISKLNYLQPIWQALRNYRYPQLQVYPDDATEPLSARLAIIVNLPAYALGLKIADAAQGDDGLLDIRLFERGSAFEMIRYCYKVALGSHESLEDVRSIRAESVRIECPSAVPVQIDGDPAGTTPTKISVMPHAVQFFIPSDS